MARPKKNKNQEEVILEGIEKGNEEIKQVLDIKKNFEAPSEKRQSNREMFSDFWMRYRFNNKKLKNIEDIVWTHLVAIKHDEPELFEAGIKHFGIGKEK